MLGRETGKFAFRKIENKFRIRTIKIPVCVQYIFILGRCKLRGGCCKIYDSVFPAEGCGLFLAKNCDRITSLTHCKQKHHLKLLA
jgi:hypothetical protein